MFVLVKMGDVIMIDVEVNCFDVYVSDEEFVE